MKYTGALRTFYYILKTTSRLTFHMNMFHLPPPKKYDSIFSKCDFSKMVTAIHQACAFGLYAVDLFQYTSNALNSAKNWTTPSTHHKGAYTHTLLIYPLLILIVIHSFVICSVHSDCRLSSFESCIDRNRLIFVFFQI